jgi:peroxiredoxin
VNKYLSLFPIATVLLFLTASETYSQKAPSAEFVLQKTATKLASARALGYTFTLEFNYPSEEYLSTTTGVTYLELRSPDSLLGFRYQSSDNEYLGIYNGSERIVGVKKKKVLVVENVPDANRIESSSVLYNSPLALRNVLPKIIADKKIPKTLTTEKVSGQTRYMVEFALRKAAFSGLGEIREMRQDGTSIYRVTIDGRTFLPMEVLLTNGKNKNFTKTTFTRMTVRPKVPTELSWYYSSYTNEYKLQPKSEKKLIEAGKEPPDFVLTEFQSKTNVALESYKGKVVLLEFWIAHCGACIAAVPRLNRIASTFAGKDFELISINLHDPEKTIASFKARNNLAYPILADGESTAERYGVGAYPAIVLIGKDGKIAYSSLGLFESELEPVIKASLEK